MATPGVRNVAETGGKSPFTTEIQAAIDSQSALELISGGGINPAPASRTVSFSASQDHSLLTLISMIAPSPDWIVGVHDYELFENGAWLDEVTLPLLAYDAGTDSGTNYTSANQRTSPQEPIALVNESAVQIVNGGPQFGTFTIRRIE